MAKEKIDCLIYTGDEVMNMLGLPKTTAYKFLNDVVEMQEKGEKVPFKVLKIGRNFKIPKELFDKWRT